MNKIHPQAAKAIRAAKQRRVWGKYATRGFLKNQKVPFGLYRLACILEATERGRLTL